MTGKIGLLSASCRILGVTLCVACNGSSQTLGGPAPGPSPAAPDFSILVFSKTAGFRHDSIPAGITAIRQLGGSRGFLVEATEDAGVFADDSLGKYKVVVFLSTTGDVLNAAQEAAFERFIRRGGGFVGVHAAADTEYDWPFYGELVGAYFAGHPAVQSAAIDIEDASHPATASLPRRWTRRDEWYNFRRNPRGSVAVLATLDERSYTGGTMAPDHPIVWAHAYEGGRAFYTGLGHTQESFSEAAFVDHLGRAILWAAAAI